MFISNAVHWFPPYNETLLWPWWHCDLGAVSFQRSWNESDKEDRLKIKDAPNFDADIFFEISGIRVDEESDKRDQQKLEILAQIEELKIKAEAL